ncbi:hypothetical protein KQI84_00620 [bacterium]|nr:hypothetical protein [bacterium]
MGRQIDYFMTAKDIEEFRRFLAKWDDGIFLPDRFDEDAVVPVDDIKEARFLTRKPFLKTVKLKCLPNEGCWVIDDDPCSAIEAVGFCPSPLTETSIRRGRMSFDSVYTSPQGSEFNSKSPEFVQWADSLLEWMFEYCEMLDDSTHTGPDAHHWAEGSAAAIVRGVELVAGAKGKDQYEGMNEYYWHDGILLGISICGGRDWIECVEIDVNLYGAIDGGTRWRFIFKECLECRCALHGNLAHPVTIQSAGLIGHSDLLQDVLNKWKSAGLSRRDVIHFRMIDNNAGQIDLIARGWEKVSLE